MKVIVCAKQDIGTTSDDAAVNAFTVIIPICEGQSSMI